MVNIVNVSLSHIEAACISHDLKFVERGGSFLKLINAVQETVALLAAFVSPDLSLIHNL